MLIKCNDFYRDFPKEKPTIFIHSSPPHEINTQDISLEPNNVNNSSHSTPKRHESPQPVIFCKDGFRSVDFVLVWDSYEEEAVTKEAYERRKIFEANLIKEGLELEYEPPENNGLNFVKVGRI